MKPPSYHQSLILHRTLRLASRQYVHLRSVGIFKTKEAAPNATPHSWLWALLKMKEDVQSKHEDLV